MWDNSPVEAPWIAMIHARAAVRRNSRSVMGGWTEAAKGLVGRR